MFPRAPDPPACSRSCSVASTDVAAKLPPLSRDASFTTIETERLRLRRFEPRDTAAFHAYRADESVARYQSWQDYTLGDAERFVEEMEREDPGAPGAPFQFAVVRRDDDVLIGDCMLVIDAGDSATAEIGYTIAPAHQGHGYATEAARALLAHAFGRYEIAAARAVTDARNAPSIAVTQHLGMHLANTVQTRFKGEACEEQTYEISRETWQTHQA